ncbi:MAG: VTT domain-containing protein [bacterium]
MKGDQHISRPGENCFVRARADRVAFIVDADDYFRHLSEALKRAWRSVYIIGWDLDSRILLRRGEYRDGLPNRLGGFINELVKRRRSLYARILVWDWAMIYALQRELMPVFRLGWRTPRRVRFHYDDTHPVGASHHQKLVVIDDSLAFCGGIDLTDKRWDTSDHLPDDPRRKDVHNQPYPPQHDVQMAVDGDAARALAELARQRWKRATGKSLPAEEAVLDPWPPDLTPDLYNAEVSMARTDPENEEGEVREVEQLYLDAICSARKYIYIENQYFTSAVAGEALSERLEEPDGPEVVVVGPGESRGWLERGTMDVLRARIVESLRQSDHYGRLGVFRPTAGNGHEAGILVHSKVMITDGENVRAGSANLSNRSMGLDTELDLFIEAGEDEKIKQGMRGFLYRLLAEHLAAYPEEIERGLVREGSLLSVIRKLRGRNRTLKELEDLSSDWLLDLIPEESIIDPESSVDMEKVMEDFTPPEEAPPPRPRWLQGTAAVFMLAAIGALWYLTPLKEWVLESGLLDKELSVEQVLMVFPVVLAAYLVGSGVMVPATLLILLTALAFGFIRGAVFSLSGILLCATVYYAAGSRINRNTVRWLGGWRLNRLTRRIAGNTTIEVVAGRVSLLAPFSVFNLVAGANGLRFKHYFAGTVIGMVPLVLLFSALGDRLREFITRPDWINFFLLAGIAGVDVLMLGWMSIRMGGDK